MMNGENLYDFLPLFPEQDQDGFILGGTMEFPGMVFLEDYVPSIPLTPETAPGVKGSDSGSAPVAAPASPISPVLVFDPAPVSLPAPAAAIVSGPTEGQTVDEASRAQRDRDKAARKALRTREFRKDGRKTAFARRQDEIRASQLRLAARIQEMAPQTSFQSPAVALSLGAAGVPSVGANEGVPDAAPDAVPNSLSDVAWAIFFNGYMAGVTAQATPGAQSGGPADQQASNPLGQQADSLAVDQQAAGPSQPAVFPDFGDAAGLPSGVQDNFGLPWDQLVAVYGAQPFEAQAGDGFGQPVYGQVVALESGLPGYDQAVPVSSQPADWLTGSWPIGGQQIDLGPFMGYEGAP